MFKFILLLDILGIVWIQILTSKSEIKENETV